MIIIIIIIMIIIIIIIIITNITCRVTVIIIIIRCNCESTILCSIYVSVPFVQLLRYAMVAPLFRRIADRYYTVEIIKT